jgi:hypothetical protein
MEHGRWQSRRVKSAKFLGEIVSHFALTLKISVDASTLAAA